jgi:hypothetical protein
VKGVYSSAAKIAALNAAKTIEYITAPAAKVVEIMVFTCTDESNATNFQMQIAVQNISAIGAPTATSVTPTPHESGDQAAGSTTKVNVTASEPTYSTVIIQEGAPALSGFRWEPQPEERCYVAPSASLGFRMITTPTAFDADVRLTFKEIG